MSDWIDRHSINCFICHKLVDERDCIDNPDENEGGEICPDCYNKEEKAK